MGRLCPDAEAELSPVHDGDKFEPDPVEPGDVAGAPVSWKNTNFRDFVVFYCSDFMLQSAFLVLDNVVLISTA